MADPSPPFSIQPFQPEHQSQARALILAGLREHWGSLDPGRNPDLEDMSSTYASGVFLVAVWQGRVIGTGGLVPKADGTAQIVRMSVAAEMRRRGVGSQILQRLCDQARSLGVRQLVLETTETWQAATAFYEHFGFKATHHLNGDIYFELEL